jgi:two-component system, cell cycle response regulator DivK
MTERPLTVLVVEDNPKNLKLFRDLLEYNGHTVFEAHDGLEAVESACLMLPDLVVMDVQLPRMNGIEVARELKNRGETKNIPLIAVTAFAMIGDEQRFLGAGFEGYIAKPINTRKFVAQVEAFFARHANGGSPDEP